MKDHFSAVSEGYAKFRPSYPQPLFNYLGSLTQQHKIALDVATGNGQVAGALAPLFEKVIATDISENQIRNAIQKENIQYLVEPAEHTSFEDRTFDLITVAQAIHWFHFDDFYSEVRRILKPGGIIAVIGYALINVIPEVDKIIDKLYTEILDGYWDPERKYMDELYQTIPFPFPEIEAPPFKMTYEWNRDEVLGFLNTWSAVQHFIRRNGKNPVDYITNEIKSQWTGDEKKSVSFPFLLRVGRNI